MLTKVPKTLIILAVSLCLVLFFYFIFQRNKNKLNIKTTSGTVSINNPAELPNNKPLSFGGFNFKENADYSIDYYAQDNGFIIAILNSNIQIARDVAEKDFMQTLGIDQSDACKLKVSLSVPFRINEKASGINYGLSFCPNGKAFPK